MNRLPLHLVRQLPLCDESAARLSGCAKKFSGTFSTRRAKVKKMYAFLLKPTAEAINGHMRWYAEQNADVTDHLLRVWEYVTKRFEGYSASGRDEIVRYMCHWHADFLGISWVRFYSMLKDPRRPSPGFSWTWLAGEWKYDPTLHVLR